MTVHSQLNVNKIVHGADCPVCGGELIRAKKNAWTGVFLSTVTLGILKTRKYECASCKKKYMLI